MGISRALASKGKESAAATPKAAATVAPPGPLHSWLAHRPMKATATADSKPLASATAWGAFAVRIQRKCAPCEAGGAPCPACAEEDEKLLRKCDSHDNGPIQLKGIEVSQPDEPDEREADRVAERVLRMPKPAARAEPSEGRPGPSLEEPPLRRKTEASQLESPSIPRAAAPDAPHSSVLAPLGAGRPLPPVIRAFFEPRFGRDLSDVRVHTGAEADDSARSVRARAFTLGRNVVFAKGAFDAESPAGRSLLAHELAHVAPEIRPQPRLARKDDDTASSRIQRAPAADDKADSVRLSISFLGAMKSWVTAQRDLVRFEIAAGEKRAAADPAAQMAHRAQAAGRANKLLNQKVLQGRLASARSIYTAQRGLVGPDDPLQGDLRQAYMDVLAELRIAFDEALEAAKPAADLMETEPRAYGESLILWLEASPFTGAALGSRKTFTAADVAASTSHATKLDDVLSKFLPYLNLVAAGAIARGRTAVKGALTEVGTDSAGGVSSRPIGGATAAKAAAVIAQLDGAESAIKRALDLLRAGADAVDAWSAKPVTTGDTAAALATYFKIADAGYAQLLSDRLKLMRGQLEGAGQLYAHIRVPGDWTCGSPDTLGQYRGAYEFVFCGSFAGAEKDAATLLHELAHAVIPAKGSKAKVAGGIPLDRAYAGERLLTFLSTEEALANAESYVQLVYVLGGAKGSLKSIPADTTASCDPTKGSPPGDVLKAPSLEQSRIRRLNSWVGDWLAVFNLTGTLPAEAKTEVTKFFGTLSDPEIEKVLRTVATMTADATGFGLGHELTCDVAGKECLAGRVAWNQDWTFTLGGAAKRAKSRKDSTAAVCPGFFLLTEDERARVALGLIVLRPGTTYVFKPEQIFKYAEMAEAKWKGDIPPPQAKSLAEHQAADAAAAAPAKVTPKP